MRKTLLLILVLLLTLVCAGASADTEYSLGEGISGKISLNEASYIVLTPDNLAEHPDTLAKIGKTSEELKGDWETRKVLLQAWSKDMKTCVEISVIQDDDSARLIDLEIKSNADRRQYLKDLMAAYRNQGYNVSDSEIKLHAKSGHYMVFNYSCKEEDGKTRRGVMRKTVRNGYSLIVDYQVYDRKPTKTDRDKGRKLINGIVIDKKETLVTPAPVSQSSAVELTDPSASGDTASPYKGSLKITVNAPEETNTGVFTIEGTAWPESEIIIVAIPGAGEPTQYPARTTKAGNFKVKVKLPKENYYNIGANMYVDSVRVEDQFLQFVKYKSTLLPVEWDAPVPEEVVTDELVISGTTVKNVSIQCLVTNGGDTTYDHVVKTNGTGKFKFKIPMTVEADYEITVVFSKKNLDNVRKTFNTKRIPSPQAVQARTASKAIHPAYNLLTKKNSSYIGKTMVYSVYIVKVSRDETNEEWNITAALKRSRKGEYSQFLNFVSAEDPQLEENSDKKIKLYGICKGTYLVQSEEGGTEGYPDFDLISVAD